jgi:hypothetical protein
MLVESCQLVIENILQDNNEVAVYGSAARECILSAHGLSTKYEPDDIDIITTQSGFFRIMAALANLEAKQIQLQPHVIKTDLSNLEDYPDASDKKAAILISSGMKMKSSLAPNRRRSTQNAIGIPGIPSVPAAVNNFFAEDPDATVVKDDEEDEQVITKKHRIVPMASKLLHVFNSSFKLEASTKFDHVNMDIIIVDCKLDEGIANLTVNSDYTCNFAFMHSGGIYSPHKSNFSDIKEKKIVKLGQELAKDRQTLLAAYFKQTGWKE